MIDFEGKRKLLTTANNKSTEQRRPLDKKRKKVEMNDAGRTRTATASKIPVRISPSRKGAFRFVQTKEEISSSDDDPAATDALKDDELKKKFQEEKRQRKRKGKLLEQLHENYNDLLEKYAQAENTIDQLRFQPKFLSEVKRSETYSADETPLSSIRPIASSSTVTPVMAMTQSKMFDFVILRSIPFHR